MIQLTLLNWLPKELGKLWIFEMFVQKKVFVMPIMDAIFYNFSWTKEFLIVARHNCGLDPNSDSRFVKEYLDRKKCILTIFNDNNIQYESQSL